MLNAAVGASGSLVREVAYLTERLEDSRGRCIVLDTGSDSGERAIALASAGFEVVAFDRPQEGIARSRHPAATRGRRVRWAAADPLIPEKWPRVDATAAICSAWWTAGHDPQRTLRRLRQYLGHGTRLIVSVAVDHADGQNAIAETVRRAGFLIERLDVNFGDPSSNGDRRTVQVVARAMMTPPESLAVHAWGSEPASPIALDLRYEPDEASFLDPRPADIWLEVCAAAAGMHSASHYPVADPYGAERAARTVERFFGCDLLPAQVTFGAGVTSLLHDLSGLADGGSIASNRLVHGDLEGWAIARGLVTHIISGSDTPEAVEQAITELHPGLLHLDRPGFTGTVSDLDTIARIARSAARYDTVLLIDESALTYLGPAASSATLVNRVPNLVVLRGFTKAYSWGGLRAGFAVASRELARHVRELIAPLQVAEASLAAALRILAAGDAFARCRQRVRQMKPPALTALKRAGLAPIKSHPDLPWVAMPDPNGGVSRRLLDLGIRPLAPSWQPAVAGSNLIRITIPLTDARHQQLLTLLASPPGGLHG